MNASRMERRPKQTGRDWRKSTEKVRTRPRMSNTGKITLTRNLPKTLAASTNALRRCRKAGSLLPRPERRRRPIAAGHLLDLERQLEANRAARHSKLPAMEDKIRDLREQRSNAVRLGNDGAASDLDRQIQDAEKARGGSEADAPGTIGFADGSQTTCA